MLAKMGNYWYVYFIKGDIQMTQSEEIKYFKELGYTLDQISILVGINKEEVERVVKSASIWVR